MEQSDPVINLRSMPNAMRRIVQSDKEEVQPSSCCYCIIPWPYPPGKNPRSPLVPYQLNGKSSFFRFTFNLLRHFLSIESLVTRTPLVPRNQPCLLLTVLLGTDGPCVAWVVAAACYGPSVPRGPLGGLSTSPSGTQTACALGLLLFTLCER
jgi:hypothetical protein